MIWILLVISVLAIVAVVKMATDASDYFHEHEFSDLGEPIGINSWNQDNIEEARNLYYNNNDSIGAPGIETIEIVAEEVIDVKKPAKVSKPRAKKITRPII